MALRANARSLHLLPAPCRPSTTPALPGLTPLCLADRGRRAGGTAAGSLPPRLVWWLADAWGG